MAKTQTYYEILGVAEHAAAEEIRRAFRNLAKQFHPDTGAAGSEKKFAAIAAAYEVLSEPESRREYDAKLAQARAEAAGSGGRGLHFSWDNIASPRRGGRTDVSEIDELYDTFYGKHDRQEGV